VLRETLKIGENTQARITVYNKVVVMNFDFL